MACEVGDFACQVIAQATGWWDQVVVWAAGFWYRVLVALPILGRNWSSIADWVIARLESFRQNPQPLVTLGALVLAITKWYQGRETQTLRRAARIVREKDRRLKGAREELIDNICRPGPHRASDVPLFIERHLKTILARRGWLPTLRLVPIPSRTDGRLNKALKRLGEQITFEQAQLDFLHQQKASAFLIRGAIAAAGSLNAEALGHFRNALAMPGNADDISAEEWQAHMLLCLNEPTAAIESYQRLEQLAASVADRKRQAILIARARRGQFSDGQNGWQSLANASADLEKFVPLDGAELLELAQTRHLEGRVRTVARPPQPSAAPAALERSKE